MGSSKSKHSFFDFHRLPNSFSPSMPHVEEERSQSLLYDDPHDSNSVTKEACLKRKRRFYPYTEDDEFIDSANGPLRWPSSPVARQFEDSVPWYQWRRKSFATPEERAKAFTVPKSNTESEDEFWDAPEPKSEKRETTIHSSLNETNDREQPFKSTQVCQLCDGFRNICIVEEAKRFLRRPNWKKSFTSE